MEMYLKVLALHSGNLSPMFLTSGKVSRAIPVTGSKERVGTHTPHEYTCTHMHAHTMNTHTYTLTDTHSHA